MASKNFSNIHFIVGDLLKENPFSPSARNHEPSAKSYEQFDLVIIKEVFWYVCHKLKDFMKNATSMIKEEGLLYVSQSFPESEDWVGKDVIGCPDRLREILLRYVDPVHFCVETDWNYNGRLFVHFLGRRIRG